jgi:putative tryptophan/tyrosine transport system substrate-binding protein
MSGMGRREFVVLLGGAAGCLSAPHAVRAQQTTTRIIGWLSLRSADTSTEKSNLAAFRQGLNQTGYVEGLNLTIEFRFADGNYDRLPALAADLVRRQWKC